MATLTFFSDAAENGCSTNQATCTPAGSGGSTPAMNTTAASGRSLVLASSAADGQGMVLRAVPGVGNWASGNYVVTVNVTGTNMNLTLDAIYVCRAASNCVNQASIGSLTGIARSLASTGSANHTVSGSAQSGASSTDQLVVVLVGDNAAMSQQSATVEVTVATPIQTVTLPAPPPFGSRYRPHFTTPRRRIF